MAFTEILTKGTPAGEFQTLNQNTTGSAATLTSTRTLAFTGDITGTGDFNGSADLSTALTIGDNKIKTDHYYAGSIDTDALKNLNVTGGKIANQTIEDTKLAGISANGTAGNVLIAGSTAGTFAYGQALNNTTITLAGGEGLTDTVGSFNLNQTGAETLTFNIDANDITTTSTAIAGTDTFIMYDASETETVKVTNTTLASRLAGTALSATNGVISLDLSAAGVISIAKGDSFFASDLDGAEPVSKFTVSNLGVFLGGTGLTGGNSDGSISVDTTQNIASITGQSSLGINSTTSITGDLSLTGDLTVSGKTITTATETLEIADNTIHLNSDLASDAAAVDTGIVAERGVDGDNACLFWDVTKDAWCIGTNSSVGFPATSDALMVNKQTATAMASLTASEQNALAPVGGMVYDSTTDRMHIRTS